MHKSLFIQARVKVKQTEIHGTKSTNKRMVKNRVQIQIQIRNPIYQGTDGIGRNRQRETELKSKNQESDKPRDKADSKNQKPKGVSIQESQYYCRSWNSAKEYDQRSDGWSLHKTEV